MNKRLVSHFIFGQTTRKLQTSVAVVHKNTDSLEATEEIQIPVKYGHISAKLWGSGETRPIVALHGWQDNAGTWDTLAPMLTKHASILAIDFPGHGTSSWIPAGMMYNQWEMTKIILYLKEYFKWEKVSIMSHSMGGLTGLRYACLYPDDVDFYISLDGLFNENYDLKEIKNCFSDWMKKGLFTQDLLGKPSPEYTLEEMMKIYHIGTYKSVKIESARHLLKRGAKQSKEDATKYYFSRDFRLKYALFTPELKEFAENLVGRLKCPILYIKSLDSPYSIDDFSVELRKKAMKMHEHNELHFVSGTHHVHLNNPEKVAPIISNFLSKIREYS